MSNALVFTTPLKSHGEYIEMFYRTFFKVTHKLCMKNYEKNKWNVKVPNTFFKKNVIIRISKFILNNVNYNLK